MQRIVHTLIGVSGSGKTTLMRKLISQCDRVLVFDALANFNYGVVSSSQYQIKQYLSKLPKKFRVVYRPQIDITDRENLAKAGDWLCMLSRSVHNCDLFFDELDSFADATHMPVQLDCLVRFGRHIGISMHAAVRRPKAVIPKHWITETNRWSIFQVTDPDDSGFLEDATHIPRDRIVTLADYHYILADHGIISDHVTEIG
jgi:hypothetical protein